MRILLVANVFNSLTQRIHAEPRYREHQIGVELALGNDLPRARVAQFELDLILSPMLTTAIPEDIWSRQTVSRAARKRGRVLDARAPGGRNPLHCIRTGGPSTDQEAASCRRRKGETAGRVSRSGTESTCTRTLRTPTSHTTGSGGIQYTRCVRTQPRPICSSDPTPSGPFTNDESPVPRM